MLSPLQCKMKTAPKKHFCQKRFSTARIFKDAPIKIIQTHEQKEKQRTNNVYEKVRLGSSSLIRTLLKCLTVLRREVFPALFLINVTKKILEPDSNCEPEVRIHSIELFASFPGLINWKTSAKAKMSLVRIDDSVSIQGSDRH